MQADAEVLCGMYDTLLALGIERFQVRFSSRKVLTSLLEFSGIPEERSHAVFRVLDKLDKAGLANVEKELTTGRIDQSGDKIPGLGLTGDQVARIKEFLALPKGTRSAVIASLETLFHNVPSAAAAIGELKEISSLLEALGVPDERVFIDLSIARGLDYYTGPVFEANLLDAPEFGSIFGGGRYDGLVERFLGKKIPAVGASIGVDRLFAALQKLGLVSLRPSTAQVLVTVMDRSKLVAYQLLTRELRSAGINTEVYLGEEKGLGRQLHYANQMGVPVAVIMGEDEFAKNEVTVKDLRAGARLQQLKSGGENDRDEWLKLSKTAQVTVARAELTRTVRGMLSSGGPAGS
jgi:histidyl-tRNA synthetase